MNGKDKTLFLLYSSLYILYLTNYFIPFLDDKYCVDNYLPNEDSETKGQVMGVYPFPSSRHPLCGRSRNLNSPTTEC